MNKQELVAAVSEETELSRAKAAQVVDAVFSVIQKALRENVEVRLTGFGSFATAARREAKGRNPRTGETMEIPASVSVRFKPGKGLKDAVSGGGARPAERAEARRDRMQA